MKKDNIHDYALAALRFYSDEGKPNDISKYDNADKADLQAVIDTLKQLESNGDDITLQSLERVYFSVPPGQIRRGHITSLVTATAAAIHVDVSTVWLALSKAKRIFAGRRGLRMEHRHKHRTSKVKSSKP